MSFVDDMKRAAAGRRVIVTKRAAELLTAMVPAETRGGAEPTPDTPGLHSRTHTPEMSAAGPKRAAAILAAMPPQRAAALLTKMVSAKTRGGAEPTPDMRGLHSRKQTQALAA